MSLVKRIDLKFILEAKSLWEKIIMDLQRLDISNELSLMERELFQVMEALNLMELITDPVVKYVQTNCCRNAC